MENAYCFHVVIMMGDEEYLEAFSQLAHVRVNIFDKPEELIRINQCHECLQMLHHFLIHSETC